MGLKQDLIDAKKEGLRQSGANEEAIQQAEQTLDIQCELEKEAIVNFLTRCQFRITELNASVILEDITIPPQQGDVLPSVQSVGVGNVGAPVNSNVINGTNGVLNKLVELDKSGGPTGILESTGYAFIGRDPDSQGSFDVSDKDGQRDFTEVKLFREDIEDLL